MRSVLALTLFVIISSAAVAQKCKYDYDKNDVMTGELTRRIDIRVSMWHYLAYFKKGDSLLISQTITYGGEQNEVIKAGAKLKIKLNDGTFLDFSSQANVSPVSSVELDKIVTRYTIVYYCTKEQLEKISEQGFSVFSYSFANQEISLELPKKSATQTAEKAKCILVN